MKLLPCREELLGYFNESQKDRKPQHDGIISHPILHAMLGMTQLLDIGCPGPWKDTFDVSFHQVHQTVAGPGFYHQIQGLTRDFSSYSTHSMTLQI